MGRRINKRGDSGDEFEDFPERGPSKLCLFFFFFQVYNELYVTNLFSLSVTSSCCNILYVYLS